MDIGSLCANFERAQLFSQFLYFRSQLPWFLSQNP